MKITKLETIHIAPRWLFLKVHTDEGLVGYGEPIVEGRAKTVEMAVRELEGYLIGKDPLQIESHWQAMYRGTFYRGGPILTSAISGIEQAMWDILDKRLGVPVYQLLGGACRNRVRAYAHVGALHPRNAPRMLWLKSSGDLGPSRLGCSRPSGQRMHRRLSRRRPRSSRPYGMLWATMST